MGFQGGMAMKMRMAFAAVLVLALFAPEAYAQSMADKAFIAVRGHAQVRAVPDTFPVSVWISEVDPDRRKAQEAVERLAREVVASARSAGIGESDMSLGNLRVASEFDRSDRGKSSFIGTRYQRSFEFRFHRLLDLKKFLSALPANKQVQSEVESFSLSRDADVKRAMLVDAVRDAKETALAYAGSVGRKLGEVRAISDKPIGQMGGGFISPIDVSSVESTTILTAEAIDRIPIGRGATSVNLIATDGSEDGVETVLSEGVVDLSVDVYIIYTLVD